MATNTVDPNQPQKLTRQQLKELETKKLTPMQRFFEMIIMILPLVCGIISILEYVLIPDKGRNAKGIYYKYIRLTEYAKSQDCQYRISDFF